jgi:malate dehydrogenase
VQFGGDEVVKAKDGAGSATLSMAYAGARFANSILRATVGGEKGIIEPTYVRSHVLEKEGVEYFSTNVELGPDGIAKIHDLGDISAYEQKLVEAAIPELKKNIAKGVSFVNEN